MEGIASVDGVKSEKLGNKQRGNVYARRTSQIENLPDALLLHILSFLPTADVVRTGVLAKRWRDFWKLASHVDIKEFPGSMFIPDLEKANPRRDLFVNFVENVLLMRDPSNMACFTLSLNVLRDASRIHSWVFAALTHKVPKLCVELAQINNKVFRLPCCLFTSRFLTRLEIAMHTDLRLPSTILLPGLEALELRFVTFSGEESANKLFSGCPNLKKLKLYECGWKKIRGLRISAPRLEELIIIDVPCRRNPWRHVVISAANLKLFSFRGDLNSEYSLYSPSLIHGYINLEYTYQIADDIKRQRETAYRAHTLLRQLAGVKSLSVSPETLAVLDWAEDLFAQLPTFHELANLYVGETNMVFPSMSLSTVLHRSPQLSLLEFDWNFALPRDFDYCTPLIVPTPPCFLTHLKTIRVRTYDDTDAELYTLNQLLDAVRVLEKLYISSLKLKNEPEGVISRLSRPSPNCQIIFESRGFSIDNAV